MYKFFVTDNQINNGIIDIIEDDVNHIKNVLRLEHNDKVEICDISSSVNYLCRILEISNKVIKCEIINELPSIGEPKVYLHIFQGLPKAEKMETIIQKTTEIGVCEITPLIMKRCVVRLDDKSIDKKILRWQKIAEIAAKQSKRDKIPKVNFPIYIKNIYEEVENYDIVLVAYENENNTGIKEVLKQLDNSKEIKIAVIIGPEGGIDENEIELLRKINTQIVSLGKRILRTETAPIVLSSIIMYEFNQMI